MIQETRQSNGDQGPVEGKKRTAYEQMSDSELILACQLRDERAFEWLVRKHERSVYALLHQLAPEWRDAADLVQETFIRVWRSIGTLRNPEAFKTWLRQIVTNIFYDQLRSRPQSAPVSIETQVIGSDDEAIVRQIADESTIPDDMYERRELSSAIEKAMEALPEEFRTAIVLRELQGLPYSEIASITHTEIGTVKSRIARARVKIQRMLSPYLRVA